MVSSTLLHSLLFSAVLYSDTVLSWWTPSQPDAVAPISIRQSTSNESTPNDQFSLPPPDPGSDDFSNNPIYTLGDQIQVSWNTDLNNISLLLWNYEASTGDYQNLLVNVRNPNGYTWVIDSDKDVTGNGNQRNPNVFHLAIYNFGDTSYQFASHWFNLTRADGTNPVTTISSSAATSTSTSSTSSTTTSTTATPTPTGSVTSGVPAAAASTTATTPITNTGLSSSAKVGLGTGLGIGIPFLIIVGALIGWRLAANRRRKGTGAPPNGTYSDVRKGPQSPPMDYQDGYQSQPYPNPKGAYGAYHVPAHELSDVQPAGQELHGSERIYHELPNAAADRR